MSDYYDEAPLRYGWRKVGELDNSEAYSVDITQVWVRPDDTYVIRSASGCSCWDGEFSESDPLTLPLVALRLITEEFQYMPSLSGAVDLMRQLFESEASNAKAPAPVSG